MKKIFIALTIIMCSCSSIPKNFIYYHDNVSTDLDTLIDIEGYYVSQHGCDSSFFSMYMFYPNGLFTIATTSEIDPELIDCFENGGKTTICKYPLWGTYRIEGDTIKTQTIRPEGGGCIIFRDYAITPNKQLINVSDYVEPQHTKLGYMENYPSFNKNECLMPAKFFKLKNKRSVEDYPFVNKGWFREK